MRRLLGALTALVCVALLSACSLLPSPPGSIGGEERAASAQMQHIADAVKSHDAAALKKLFSPRARENATDLDGGLTYFLSAFPSGPVTWKTQGTGDSGGNVFLKRITELFGNYEVSAAGKKYELYFAYFSINDFHPDEVGMYALGVVPAADDGYTESGEKMPFTKWASQFDIDEKTNTATGNPGVYVPQS
ncbi:MAG: DUF5104 domain-containing protein [Pseudolysinimonas sp.]